MSIDGDTTRPAADKGGRSGAAGETTPAREQPAPHRAWQEAGPTGELVKRRLQASADGTTLTSTTSRGYLRSPITATREYSNKGDVTHRVTKPGAGYCQYAATASGGTTATIALPGSWYDGRPGAIVSLITDAGGDKRLYLEDGIQPGRCWTIPPPEAANLDGARAPGAASATESAPGERDAEGFLWLDTGDGSNVVIRYGHAEQPDLVTVRVGPAGRPGKTREFSFRHTAEGVSLAGAELSGSGRTAIELTDDGGPNRVPPPGPDHRPGRYAAEHAL